MFQKVPEGFIAFVEELPGANTQRATLEARANLEEAAALVLETNRGATRVLGAELSVYADRRRDLLTALCRVRRG